ncbi:MAG: PH domain-containing protein [Anaeromassilibacillus sp.]|nr:PH domain-containing protein [Anaeromassilibacillus sp.]MDY3780325.1 PH domain-containing protein [Candidatus Limousia pullorum]
MIDFENGDVFKLRKVKDEKVDNNILTLLVPKEEIIGVYKSVRDYVVFTNRRFISVNIQGVTGKRRDYTIMPYSKISVFSIETSGVLDIDSELQLFFSGVGKVTFEFTGSSDIVEIGQMISRHLL